MISIKLKIDIDFGGTSVWYHIFNGEKVFLLIPPTPENVKKYEQWLCSREQSTTFFADLVDCCYNVTLKAKQTMRLPSFWIHAVYTPSDTIAFGINVLNSLNIADQLNIPHPSSINSSLVEQIPMN